MRAMPSVPLRWKLLGAFGAVLTILTAQSARAFRTTIANQQATEWVTHTQRVIGLADEALTALVDVETGYWGFLLSGDEAFLEPHHTGAEAFREMLDRLRLETSDNPAQVQRWQEIERRMAEWQQTAERGIALRHEVDRGGVHPDAITVFVRSGGGKARFDATCGVFADAIGAEQDLLGQHQQHQDAANTLLLRVLVAGTLVALGVGLAVALLLAHGIVGAVAAGAAGAAGARQIAQRDLPLLADAVRTVAQALGLAPDRVDGPAT